MIFVFLLVLPFSHWHLCRYSLVYQRLVVTSGSSGVDAGVDHAALYAFVGKQVLDASVISRVGVEQVFRAQVSELVWRDNNPGSPSRIGPYEVAHGLLAFGSAV
jgi:hypothetical protein